jgi:streptogramin lyase
MRHLSATVGNAIRNYFVSTWRQSVPGTSVLLMAAGMAVCPAAHAFVTAADFSGLESRIESGSIHSPLGVAVDGSGNVYIAQSSGVLKETLSPDGSGLSETVVVSFAGVTQAGIAVDRAGNLYLGMNGAVYKETLADGSYSQSIIASSVKKPDWIAVDGRGNVYIADNAANQVLKETPSGDHYTQSVVFPPAASGANALNGLAVDAIGNVYFVNDGNVWKATPADSGYHVSLLLAGAYGRGLAVDGIGDLYVTVGNTQVLHETLADGKFTQSTVATGRLPIAVGLAVDSGGNLYVGDLEGNRILKEYSASSPVRAASSAAATSTVSMLSTPDGNTVSR